MPNLSRIRSLLYNLKPRSNKQRINDAVAVVIFCYLILYSVFYIVFTDVGPASGIIQPDGYDIKDVAVTPIRCSFPISSQYQRTQRYIVYLLLTFTFVVRNQEWLAAGAAASVMTYSGVAAIHLIILFATNNKLKLPKAKLRCESVPIPGASAPFLACAGVDDPDATVTMTIVSSVMLGALPTAGWSSTFRRSTSKAILTVWLLLLAVAHPFYALIWSDPSYHFQICPKDHVEPVPTANFQAPILDQPWSDSFHFLVSTAQQQSSRFLGNGSSPACIYSCFATTGYIGRETQDIGVLQDYFPVSAAENRRNAIIFWLAYTFLAFLTFLTTEKKRWLPKWVHKPVFLVECRQQPLGSRWEWRSLFTKISIKRTDATQQPRSSKIDITILKLVQLLTQVVCVAAFCGSVIIQEMHNGHGWFILEREPFTAVGQWGNVAVVSLVLLAAGLGRIWGGRGARSAVLDARRLDAEGGGGEADTVKVLSEGGKRSIEDARKGWTAGMDGDLETEREDWDWRVGYAS